MAKATKPIKLFNTASRQVEDFFPLKEGEVSMYACGPTVYHYAHIGNMRTYVFEDVLRRTLEHAGYNVRHAMNITDVGHLQSDADEGDDKMMVASKRESKSPWEIAKFYEDEFFRHSELLNIKRPHIVARATDHIPEIISMVQTLIEKDYGYIVDNNVYFDVSKFDRYTEFAGLIMEDQVQTERVEADRRKKNQADFVLWFSQSKYPNQIMKWESPWGVGFPGWHIECSAMASKHLGKRIDIHCGGIDHIRVHHTNEIAQSECCYGHKWVNYWMHGEFLNVEDGKMSKSKGDFLTVDKLIEDGFSPLDYRYLLLTTHYRSALNFSYEALMTAKNSLRNLQKRISEWKSQDNNESPKVSDIVKEVQSNFWKEVYNDLHTPKALALAWGAAKSDKLSAGEKLYLFEEFDQLFGLSLDGVTNRKELTSEQERLIEAREIARAKYDWAESDRIRNLLLKQGIQLKDPKKGSSEKVSWEPYP